MLAQAKVIEHLTMHKQFYVAVHATAEIFALLTCFLCEANAEREEKGFFVCVSVRDDLLDHPRMRASSDLDRRERAPLGCAYLSTVS